MPQDFARKFFLRRRGGLLDFWHRHRNKVYMFKVEPLLSDDRAVKCRLLIDGKPLENAFITRDTDGRLHISTSDHETSNQLTSYTLLELPPLEGLSLPYQPSGSEL